MEELRAAIRYIKNARKLSAYASLQAEAEKKMDKAVEKIQSYISKQGETNISSKRWLIFSEIDKERKRQDEKWGEQNHPMLLFETPETIKSGLKHARFMNKNSDRLDWFYILMEEVYEAFAETDPVKQGEEIIQVAAVAVQIIECLKRKMEARK
jgi:membrane-anchored protein YejM (alkaline phosphatase superfamily)